MSSTYLDAFAAPIDWKIADQESDEEVDFSNFSEDNSVEPDALDRLAIQKATIARISSLSQLAQKEERVEQFITIDLASKLRINSKKVSN